MSDLEKIEKLQANLKRDPSNFQIRRQLAMLLLDNGYKKEALAHFLHLAEIFKNDAELFYNMGIVYEKLKDLNNAEKAYQKAIEYATDGGADAYYNLGLVYIDKGQYDKAIDCFETVLDAEAEDAQGDSNTYFNIGIAYFKMEKYDSAKYYFLRTVELNPDDIYAHFYLGNIEKITGNPAEARSRFEKVLGISPDYSWAYYNLAVIDFEEDNLKSALENLQKTINYNPKDMDAYKIWAKILMRNNAHTQAVKILDTAIKKCGEFGDLYYLLGEAYKAVGDKERAKNSISLALKHYATLTYDVNLVKEKLNGIV